MFQIGRKEQVVLFIIMAALLFGSGYRLAQHKLETEDQKPILVSENDELEPPKKPAKPKELVVHVSGAVKAPGVYKLSQGSRVIDAVEMAGGAKDNADLDRLNLAAPLTDGQKVPVFGVNAEVEGEEPLIYQEGAVSEKININTANESELSALPGIGPALSKRIIEYRTNFGTFKATDAIKNVSGIGDKKYENLKNLISIY